MHSSDPRELKSGSVGIQICLRNAELHMEEKVNGNKRFSIPVEEWRKSSGLRRSVLNKAISGGCELTLGMSSLQMCISLCLCTSLHAQLFVVHQADFSPNSRYQTQLGSGFITQRHS